MNALLANECTRLSSILFPPLVQIRSYKGQPHVVLYDSDGRLYPTTIPPKHVDPTLRGKLLNKGIEVSLLDHSVMLHLIDNEHCPTALAHNVLGAVTTMRPRGLESTSNVLSIEPPMVGQIAKLITAPSRQFVLTASMPQRYIVLGAEICEGSQDISGVYLINRLLLETSSLCGKHVEFRDH